MSASVSCDRCGEDIEDDVERTTLYWQTGQTEDLCQSCAEFVVPDVGGPQFATRQAERQRRAGIAITTLRSLQDGERDDFGELMELAIQTIHYLLKGE